jgi:CRP-like cAMP-binding protein
MNIDETKLSNIPKRNTTIDEWITVTDEEMLDIMKKEYRSDDDNKKIICYLRNMNEFLEILKKQSENSKESLINVADAIRGLCLPAYQPLFRYGEKGNAFYIIFKGSVNVIIPNQKEYILSKEEYLEYLALLSHYGETEVLKKCLNLNKFVTNITENDIRDYILKNRKKFTTITDYFTTDFTQNLKPVVRDLKMDKRKAFQIFTFHQVKQLVTGDIFGDLALENENNVRTATVVTDSECIFGMIMKNFYVKSIKNTNTKLKESNLMFILATPFFQGVSSKSTLTFQKFALNAFTTRRLERKDFLIKENDEPINVYFIKTGQYEICMNKSVMELNELIRYFGGKVDDDLNEYEVIYENKSYMNFVNAKKYARVIFY